MESSITKDGNIFRDSGYIVQFDRGYSGGEIVIRRRTNGVEGRTPIAHSAVFVENKTTSPNWWTQNQDLKVVVTAHESDPTKNYLSVFVNGNPNITNLVIDANPDSNQNHTGVRGWGNQSSTIENITITPQD